MIYDWLSQKIDDFDIFLKNFNNKTNLNKIIPQEKAKATGPVAISAGHFSSLDFGCFKLIFVKKCQNVVIVFLYVTYFGSCK